MSAVQTLKNEIALERAAGVQHDLAEVAVRTLRALAADHQIIVLSECSYRMTPAGAAVAREILVSVKP